MSAEIAPAASFAIAGAPTPRRQVFVGTAVACLAGTMLIGGMLAIWVLLRERFLEFEGDRFVHDYTVTEVASNVMLITLWTLCLFAQWAVYSAKRGDRVHTGVSLGVVAVLAIAYLNAQAFVWHDMAVPVAENKYGALFYAMTGTMTALIVIGLVYTVVAAFRSLGGRLYEGGLLSAHALYWYFAAAAYSAVWFVVYVTK